LAPNFLSNNFVNTPEIINNRSSNLSINRLALLKDENNLMMLLEKSMNYHIFSIVFALYE
jgi:hypothetical protein